jgi:hypothetical protein
MHGCDSEQELEDAAVSMPADAGAMHEHRSPEERALLEEQ